MYCKRGTSWKLSFWWCKRSYSAIRGKAASQQRIKTTNNKYFMSGKVIRWESCRFGPLGEDLGTAQVCKWPLCSPEHTMSKEKWGNNEVSMQHDLKPNLPFPLHSSQPVAIIVPLPAHTQLLPLPIQAGFSRTEFSVQPQQLHTHTVSKATLHTKEHRGVSSSALVKVSFLLQHDTGYLWSFTPTGGWHWSRNRILSSFIIHDKLWGFWDCQQRVV